MRKHDRLVGAAVAVVLLVGIVGCKAKTEVKVKPKITPPAIAKAGVLRVGVDLSTPPFAGVDKGRKAGIDIDVAGAIGERLAVRVTYVDVPPSEAATALANGSVDMVMSVPLSTADLSRMTAAGTYLSDFPAIFVATDTTASIEPSLTLESLSLDPVGAQNKSEAYWTLTNELGEESVKPFDSLRAAFQALDAGGPHLVAGDALVGGYLLRDFPNIQMAGRLADSYPLAAMVAPDNAKLSASVSSTLDALVADGVVDSIRKKWVGDLPDPNGSTSATSTGTSK